MIMNKTAQNLTWNCLPLEVKKEVKRQYQIASNAKEHFTECTLEYLFGSDNLTSDAEEEEMLTVSRKRVQEMYYYNEDILFIDPTHSAAILLKKKLQDLFGSKCLPDQKEFAENANCKESKPAEPKFKVCDKVKDISSPHDDGIYRVDDIKKSSDGFIYHIQGLIGKSNVKESDLEPYTEPEKPTRKETKEHENAFAFDNLIPPNSGKLESQEADNQFRNLSQNIVDCDKLLDNILIDASLRHNRLHIAAMAMQGLLSNADRMKQYGEIAMRESETLTQLVARNALRYADALIAKAEKGGEK